MRARRTCRVAVLASHPIQYFTPLYKRLASHPDVDVEVMFYRDFGIREQYDEQFARTLVWDTNQLDGYSHRFLANISPIRNTFNPLHAINPGAFSRLLGGFDAVWLNGYTYPSNWLARAAARLRGSALLFRSDFRLHPDRTPKRLDLVRERIIRSWVRGSQALLYVGQANRDAYVHYGAQPSQLFFSPFSVDVTRIAAARRDASRDLPAHRRKWGVPADRCIVLFAGKLTARKHPEAALALAESPELSEEIHVVFAGSGPLEEDLKARARASGLSNTTFLGFVNQSRLPEVYACADIFVMPSEREPWGLALNEAMAAGVVPVVTNGVGASDDLVRGLETGFEVPVRDQATLHAAVAKLVQDPDLRDRLSIAAAARAAEYNYDASVRGIVEALRSLRLLSGSDAV